MSHLMLAPPQVDQTQSKLISFLIESVGRLCRRQWITVKQTLMLQIHSMGEEKKKKNDSLIPSPTSTGSVPYMSGKLILYPLLGNIFSTFLRTDFIILPNGFWQKNQKGGLLQRPTTWGMTAKNKTKTINKILLINNWPVFNLWKWKIQ